MKRWTLFFTLAGLLAMRAAAEPLVECQARDGLPNVFAKLEAGGEVRVAYLGGSITDAEGWRVLSRKWLAEQYPAAKVTEIRATICGTGAELGACRVGRDVLQHKPDLLFVEFAVNGAGSGNRRPIQSMEGIVRQTWRANPKTDICFVFTAGTWFLGSLQQDNLPYPMTLMDKVAEHYKIPTINFALDVARKVKTGTLVYQGAKSHDGDKIVFSGDGVHPFLDTGHPLYLDAIVRSVPALKSASKPGAHAMPEPLDADNWERATLIPMEQITKSEGWTKIDPPGDPWGAGVAKQYLPSVWKAVKPGESVDFKFRGTAFGIAGLRGADSGQFRVTVDGKSQNATQFDHYARANRWMVQPWIFPGELANGDHTVKMELLADAPDKEGILKKSNAKMDDPAGFKDNFLYFGGILLAGDIVQ